MISPPTIPALLRHAAREFGPHTYVITPTGRISYADAEQLSADAACRLLALGVGKGTRVGLYFANGLDWIIWWLAASRIGALVVPLSTMYTPAELAKVLRLADIGVLVAPERVLDIDVGVRLEEALPGLSGQQHGRIALDGTPYLRHVVLTGDTGRSWAGAAGERVAAELLAAVEAEVSAADLAIMVHTSGSTADPKGVVHTHGTLVRQTSTWPAAARLVTGSGADGTVLCAMPFFWIGGVLAATGALHEPTTIAVLPRLEAGAALDLIERERVTGVIGWPAFTQRLRDHPTFAARDLSSAPRLRDGPLDIAMVDVPDGYPVHRTMSETAGGFAFTDLLIVDDAGAPVPDGTVGELLVRGIGVMAGYNKRERADTFDADGWYHTADRVYRRTGDPRLFYVGRRSDLIKTAGANVSPLEVEAVLDTHPGVAQSVVLGVDDPQRGEQVCAVLVPAGPDFAVDAVAAVAREQLSAYKVPNRWIVLGGAELPVLASGKLDRKTLRQWVTEGRIG